MKIYVVLRPCIASSWRGFRHLQKGDRLELVAQDGSLGFFLHVSPGEDCADDTVEPFEVRGWQRLPLAGENEPQAQRLLKSLGLSVR